MAILLPRGQPFCTSMHRQTVLFLSCRQPDHFPLFFLRSFMHNGHCKILWCQQCVLGIRRNQIQTLRLNERSDVFASLRIFSNL